MALYSNLPDIPTPGGEVSNPYPGLNNNFESTVDDLLYELFNIIGAGIGNLKIDNPLSGTGQYIEDVDNTASPLMIATDRVGVNLVPG